MPGSVVAYEPKILGLLCNWCSYSAADLAAQSQLDIPVNIRVARIMCSGRVEPAHILKALAGGADGVLVCGCHHEDCHYINGNTKALGRITLLKRMLEDFGIEKERVRLEWISAQESEKYARVTREMVDELRGLGELNWSAVLSEEIQAHPELEEVSDSCANPHAIDQAEDLADV
ncbi:hydrogenase iron-sulfur subunit [Myxococcota bacterium]|nr:hydrogenase iron-sulfur subunit [Myxococcota bacterium]